MNKFQLATLEDDVLRDLDNPSAWMDYLKITSWHYKHTFYNQLLIACQREDATAVTTMKAWNHKLNRYVNAGSKRILILENTGNRREFVNVFDVSDTHLNKKDGYQFKLWSRNINQDNKLMKEIGTNGDSFPVSILSRVDELIEDRHDDLKAQIEYSENPQYNHVDPDELIMFIRESIAYQVLERCGENGKSYFSEDDFKLIEQVNNFDLLTFIGCQVNEVVKPLLIEIGKAVIEIEKGEQANEQIIQVGQSELQPGRGLPESEYQTNDASKSADREVRNASRSISRGTPSDTIDSVDLQQSDQRTFSGSGSGSQTENESNNNRPARDLSSTGSQQQSAGMGQTYENAGEPGGGDRSERDRLYQVENDPEDQLNLFSLANNQVGGDDKTPSAFYSIKNEIIDRILQSGANSKYSDLQITYHYSLDFSDDENCQFLRSHFGTDAKGLKIDGNEYAIYWDDQGLFIGQGNTFKSNFANTFLSWNDVNDRIKDLLGMDLYLTKDRVKKYLGFEIGSIANQFIHFYRDLMPRGQKLLPSIKNIYSSSFLDSQEVLYNLIYESYYSQNKTFINRLIEEFNTLDSAIENDPKIVRFKRNLSDAERIIDRLSLLNFSHREFDAIYEKIPKAERFVTQDEIDMILLHKNERQYQIYKFFVEGHTQPEKENFIKNRYGQGGHGSLNTVSVNYDGKGMEFKFNQETSISLTWVKISKRIDKLIETGQYNIDGYFADEMFEDAIINQTPHPDLKQAIITTIDDQSLSMNEKENLIQTLYRINGDDFEPATGDYIQKYSDRGITFIHKENKTTSFEPWFSVIHKIETLQMFGKNGYFPSSVNDLSEDDEDAVIEKNNTSITHENVDDVTSNSFTLGNPHIDRIIQNGSNDPNSDKEIAYYFSLGLSVEQNCVFLKDHFKTGANGFVIDGNQYAAYWDDQGFFIGDGETYKSNFQNISLSWEDVENRIQYLLSEGNFISNDRLATIDDFEIETLSNRCVEIYWDLSPENREYLPILNDLVTTNDFPVSKLNVFMRLSDSFKTDKDFIKQIAVQMGNLADAIEQNPEIRKLKYVYTVQSVADRLTNLKNNHLSFQSHIETLSHIDYFITKDDINMELLDARHVYDGRYQIYNFFKENHSQRDRVKFLKNAYGRGGHSNSDLYNWHDADGFNLSREIGNDKISVFLPWSDVATRISKMINSGEYNIDNIFPNSVFREILKNELPHPDIKHEISKLIYDNSLGFDGRIIAIGQTYRKYGDSYEPNSGIYNQKYTNNGISFTHKESNISHFEPWISVFSAIDDMCRWHSYLSERDQNDSSVESDVEPLNNSETVYASLDSFLLDTNLPVNESIRTEISEFYSQNSPDRKDFCFFVWDVYAKYNLTNARSSSGINGNGLSVTIGDQELLFSWLNVGDKIKELIDQGIYALDVDHSAKTLETIIDQETDNIQIGDRFKNQGKIWEVTTISDESEMIGLKGICLPSDAMNIQIDKFSLLNQATRIDSDYVPIQIGNQFLLDDRLFEVDSFNSLKGTLSLKDITFAENAGFPIFREESYSVIESMFSDGLLHYYEADVSKNDIIKDNIQIKPQNYRIHASDPQPQPAREKFLSNIKAIEVLQKIESENRFATPDEQEILAKYLGWGGLPQAFDKNNNNWNLEYNQLKSLLSDDEYSKARESTLNAHYTSPTVIKAMYGALSNMGFQTGNVLEPAMGTGNFFGMLPDAMKGSKLYGVEIDSLTARISKQLYPNANVFEGGFEKSDYSNNFFDVAIGNVPFGDYKLYDKNYQNENFLIHDYFFAKSLDKLRPGGVMAMITSKGTMDKKSPAFREYMAKRAELLGAVRLPNNAFNHAGTEVTSDILFFKKRDRMTLGNDSWVHLDTDEKGISMNAYFVKHPEMIIGEMSMISGRFGQESACLPVEGKNLGVELRKAINHIEYHFPEDSVENTLDDEQENTFLQADPNVENYSYTVVDDQIYFRSNSVMHPAQLSGKAEERVKGLIELRDVTRELIQLQLHDEPNEVIEKKQDTLNTLYDQFIKKNNRINSRGNKLAFEEDGSYWLLCALEKIDDDGNFIGKSDIFTQRTIAPVQVIESVETANEALILSIGEKAKVDLPYMEELCGLTQDEIIRDLQGVIFHDPKRDSWITADEYLSGNVREKLENARIIAEADAKYSINVAALEKAQPKDLEASEIEVNLGATWIDPEYIDQFILETFKPAAHLIHGGHIKVNFSENNGSWNIEGKSMDSYDNVLVNATYGTKRANAYKILENSINLRETRISDRIDTPDGYRYVLNKEETILANQKADMIKEAFKDWIFKDQERRNTLVKKYNQLFNSTRPREFDGQHVILHGTSPDIELRDYQKNAVARALYGGNTLLGHCVGAGKTFEMVSVAMESKYLGLCNKSMFVVPNHLVGQWGSSFLALYPGANILVAQKKDFTPGNRKKFCSRIATGNYDAVIIGHSQFEKIPLSKEFQAEMLDRQIESVLEAINDAVDNGSEQYTIKQLEKTRKSLQERLEKLNDIAKDNTVTFEELGVDRLFVDEAHSYKNLFMYTKMRNVAGVGQSEARKSTDMFNKCRYMDQLTGSKGIIFATGTPISNSISELYTMMRYLQFDRLQQSGLGHFDSWASNFTQQVTAVELSPEGTGYRSKTRLARFYNLPELMSFFKEIADIQTPDMLNLPVPEVTYIDEKIKPSEFQKDMLNDLVDRAKAVRNRAVEPYEDNMLKITNDGRKLALDQRLINPLLPENDDSKSNRCVENAYRVWEQTHDNKSAQLLFCDLSTPQGNGEFNIYDDIKNKLILKGVPEDQIAFIHYAKTDVQKDKMFGKVRSGQIRFLLGSTPKMGAGTNVQDRLIALHHLDVPWKPADIEQQEGRILRQGNMNPEVKIFRYITEQTFDAYSWQLIENKQKFIGQVMTSKSPSRSCEDVDEQALSYAEVKALATGNPLIKEKMDLDIKVTKLKLMKSNHANAQYRMEDNITKVYPVLIENSKEMKEQLHSDLKLAQVIDPENFSMMIGDKFYSDKKEAGEAILNAVKTGSGSKYIGKYACFKMSIEAKFEGVQLTLKGSTKHTLFLGKDAIGNITRINNTLQNIPDQIKKCEQNILDTQERLENAQIEVLKPFPQEQELTDSLSRLKELDIILSADQPQIQENEMEGEDAEWEEMEA